MLKKYISYIMISLSLTLPFVCTQSTVSAAGVDHTGDAAVIIQEMKKSFVLADEVVKQIIQENIPNLNMAFSSSFSQSQVSHDGVSQIRAALIVDLFKRCFDAESQSIDNYYQRQSQLLTESVNRLPLEQQIAFIAMLQTQQPPRFSFEASVHEPLGTYTHQIKDALKQDGDRVLRDAFNFFKNLYPELDESILSEGQTL